MKQMQNDMNKMQKEIEELKKHKQSRRDETTWKQEEAKGEDGWWGERWDGKGGGGWWDGARKGEGWKHAWGKNDGEERQLPTEGRHDDRRNEMVARGFRWNTNWKKIKGEVEGIMGEAGVE